MSSPPIIDWYQEEEDLHSLRRELDRIKRRARARLRFPPPSPPEPLPESRPDRKAAIAS